MSDVLSQVATRIISEQENVIGPLAVEQARTVPGLKVDWAQHSVSFDNGDQTQVVDNLVNVYKGLFGQTSVEVCKEAAGPLLTQLQENEIPSLLR